MSGFLLHDKLATYPLESTRLGSLQELLIVTTNSADFDLLGLRVGDGVEGVILPEDGPDTSVMGDVTNSIINISKGRLKQQIVSRVVKRQRAGLLTRKHVGVAPLTSLIACIYIGLRESSGLISHCQAQLTATEGTRDGSVGVVGTARSLSLTVINFCKHFLVAKTGHCMACLSE